MKTSSSGERKLRQLEEQVDRTSGKMLAVLNADWESEHIGALPETVSAIHCLALRKVLRVVIRPLMAADVSAASNTEIQSYDSFVVSCAEPDHPKAVNNAPQKPEIPARRKWSRKAAIGISKPTSTAAEKSESMTVTPAGIQTE